MTPMALMSRPVFSVSEGNVITLTVHHRAGNPVADGVPFEYPVVAGSGWVKVGPGIVVVGLLEESLQEILERIARENQAGQVADPPYTGQRKGCLVPRLKGRSLKGARRRLRESGCTVGQVRKIGKTTPRTGRVIKQSLKPWKLLGPGAMVDLTLAR